MLTYGTRYKAGVLLFFQWHHGLQDPEYGIKQMRIKARNDPVFSMAEFALFSKTHHKLCTLFSSENMCMASFWEHNQPGQLGVEWWLAC